MTDDKLELSRRKILAGIGAMGVAGAGAGMGTSAYFSDQETFANNQLTAGELDLKVDWEEHYSDWSNDENDDRTDDEGGDESNTDLDDDDADDFEVRMEEPTNTDGFTAFPPGVSEFEGDPNDPFVTGDPLLWVPDEFVDDFMANTALEAFPDMDNDGSAEFPVDQIQGEPCNFLADVGEDDEGLETYTKPNTNDLGRTDNEDTRLDDDSPAPLINLTDVKPGDFGEITFSTHLCDNPGYLWMNMPGGLETSENGVNEPEAEDEDEDQVQGTGEPATKDPQDDPTVELADKLQTALWYDSDCDNLFDCEEPIDVMAVADVSGTIDGVLGDSNTEEEIDLIAEGANIFINTLQDRAVDSDQVRAGLLTFNEQNESNLDGSNVFGRPALRAGLGPLDQFDQTSGDGFNANVEEFLPTQGNGATPMPHALDIAEQVLDNDPDGRANARKVILLVTDGLPNYTGDDDFGNPQPYTVEENEGGPLGLTGITYTQNSQYTGTGDNATSPIEKDETANLAEDIQNNGVELVVAAIGEDIGDEAFLEDEVAGQDGDRSMAEPAYFFDVDFPGQLDPGEDPIDKASVQLAEFLIGGTEGCEEIIFTGTLREAAAALTANDGRGIPLDDNQTTLFDELSDPEDADSRECFGPGHTSCFGFSWWLPLDHGNEVQTDSVSFDIGFYTEQCRHNDGGGIANSD